MLPFIQKGRTNKKSKCAQECHIHVLPAMKAVERTTQLMSSFCIDYPTNSPCSRSLTMESLTTSKRLLAVVKIRNAPNPSPE